MKKCCVITSKSHGISPDVREFITKLNLDLDVSDGLNNFIFKREQEDYDVLFLYDLDERDLDKILNKIQHKKHTVIIIAAENAGDIIENPAYLTFKVNLPLETNDKLKRIITEIKMKLYQSILVIEDEEINQEIIKEILSKEQVHTRIVSSGDQALISIHHHRPNLILLDFNLPHMNGDEVLYWIRGRYNGEELPVIVISSQEDKENVLTLAKLGVQGYLVKPFEPEDFIKRIRSVLKL